MDFAKPLVPGRLLRRYKRFLADVELEDGRVVTAHCANPGAMLGLNEPGSRIWLEPNENPARKLKFTWRLVDLPGGYRAGIDTGIPNQIIAEALADRSIPELDHEGVRAEQRYGANSRIDFLLDGPRQTYVEVKNVHLMREDGLAEFPDCVTARGAKHLGELAAMVADGHRAVMLYVVQRDDCDRMALAADLDPRYAEAFLQARRAGVEAIVYRAILSTERITLGPALPFVGEGVE